MTVIKQVVSQRIFPKTLFLFLFFLLLFILPLPLPLGSNRHWAYNIGQICVYCLLLLYAGFDWHHAKKAITQNWFPIGVFTLVICWVAFKHIAIPIEWLQMLSPNSAAAYQMHGLEWESITIDKEATMNAILNYTVQNGQATPSMCYPKNQMM